MRETDATLWELCRDKEYRHLFAFCWLGLSLARQIHLMRRKRGWSVREFSRQSGLSYATCARLEVWCGNTTIHTLLRVAHTFDVALIVRFISWGEFFLTIGAPVDAPRSFNEEFTA